MPTSVAVSLSQDQDRNLLIPAARFPDKCVVCLEKATKEYMAQKTYNVGRAVIPITLHLPMCDAHFAKASFKSPAEKLVGGPLAVVGGLLLGIFGAWLTGRPWDPQFEISLIASVFLTLLFGAIGWVIIAYYAPKFADPSAKDARDAVQITKYEPYRQVVHLEFRHAQLADGVDTGGA